MGELDKIAAILKSDLPDALKLELVQKLIADEVPAREVIWPYPVYPVYPVYPSVPYPYPTWTWCETTTNPTFPNTCMDPS